MPAGLIVGTALPLWVAAATWSGRGWPFRALRAQWWARERRGDTQDAFIQVLQDSGVEPLVARATYAELQRDMRTHGVRSFPVRATDDLAEIYGLSVRDGDAAGNLDLRYTVTQIARRTDRALPRDGLEAALRPLRTVVDVARWVQSLPVVKATPVTFVIDYIIRITGHGNVAIGDLLDGRPAVGMYVQAEDDPASRFVVNGIGATSRPERTGLLLGPDQPVDALKARLPAGTVLREVSAP